MKKMKRLMFVLVTLLCLGNLQAQQINESFENTQFVPSGWTSIDSDAYCKWKRVSKDDNQTLSIFDGRACAVVPGCYQTENYLITPQLRPMAGEQLHFAARVRDYSSVGMLKVEVSTNGTEASSFVAIATYPTSSTAENHLWKSDWQEYTIDMSAYIGQRIYVAFHQVGEADNIYLDAVSGVSLAGSASCEPPYNVEVSDVAAQSVTISWQGEAAQYQYVYLPAGTTLTWTNAVTINTNTVVLNNLQEETAYDFYVRSYCSSQEQSIAPLVSFRTPCESLSIPWIETFTRDATGTVAPDCWFVSSANPQVWVVADKTYDEEGNASTIYGQAHLYAAGGGPTTAQVFAMPVFDTVLNALEVAFDYKTSMAMEGYGVLEIGYMSNPSSSATFVALDTLEQTLNYTRVTYPLSSIPSGVKYVAFRFAGGTSDFSGVSMDNFVVAKIGHSGEIDPSDEEVPDAAIWGLNYCEAQFTWYAYNTDAFAIGLFDAEAQELIAGIAVTTGECDRFAQADGVGFSEDDDYENHYYCSTKWILNVDEEGLAKGNSWSTCVINVGTAVSPVLGLKAGSYQVQVYALNATTGERGALLATIPFTLYDKKVENLAVVVADNKETATLTWETPALSTGERLYVSVRAGETVAYDNFDTSDKPVSPLTVDVVEGKSYSATIQILDKNKNPLGSEVACLFTVGVNPYEPRNLHAEVFGGDNVTFTWEVTTEADFYDIALYLDGAYYSTLSVRSTTKTTTMPKDGTWSWTVQPFTKGTTGKYFAAANAIAGNDFVSHSADIPEDAIVMNVWGFEAAYLDEASGYYQEGKHGWMLMFATGDEGGTGYPQPWFLVYTKKESAISGSYNVARQNIDLESCYINTNGTQAGCIMATDAEVRLQFDGFDEESAELGYRYGYYTGRFRLVGEDGKTYVGKFMELFCNSYNFSTYASAVRDHKGMWDEDPDAEEPEEDGLESIIESTRSQSGSRKVLYDGKLYIVTPSGAVYDAKGSKVE